MHACINDTLDFNIDHLNGQKNLKHNYKVWPTIIIINSVYSDPARCVIQPETAGAEVTIREVMKFLTPFVSRSAMSPVSRVEYPW